MTDILEKALRVAAVAHRDQKRKESDLPYITHPVAVAMKLLRHGFPDHVVAAALLHDVLEDTEVTEQELRETFGKKVLAIVQALTYQEGLSWEEKREAFAGTLKDASDEVKAVTIGDRIHNAESILLAYEVEGPEVWKHFNRGKEKKMWSEQLILRALKEGWRHPLIKEYEDLLLRMGAMKES